MTKTPSIFECQSCGYSSAKWLGRCPDCGSWNSFIEEKRPKGGEASFAQSGSEAAPVRLSEASTESAPRIGTLDAEFDRVLGGGIVPGSLILLGGEPGAGKSTLLLQIAQSLQKEGQNVLYVSGEESVQQIKLRADRLEDMHKEVPGKNYDIYILSESNFEHILSASEEVQATTLVLDSVQTTFSETLDSAPGSVSQVRHIATRCLNLAKSRNLTIFIIGHVTKDGTIAGPKALEHIVDVVLYFEGERRQNHRIIRAVKNRFGAANEVGIFEMTSRGLIPVRNPSSLFLLERENISPGSAVVCALEGTRPLLVEIQALVVATQYGTARRVATGIDYNRISVLVAMLEKRLGIQMNGCDIYANTAGGLGVDEPGADLGIFAAILSSLRNRPLPAHTVLMGELSLSGDVRPISQAHLRLRETAAMGFLKCILPAGNLPLVEPVDGIELIPIRNVAEVSDLLFG